MRRASSTDGHESSAPRSRASEGLRGRILVVEDDPELASPLAAELKHCGHEVQVERDGLAAVSAAREWGPDLVVLDLGLPTVDGMEVCHRIRSFSRVPILILTARDSVGDRVSGLDAGADDYLTKPFSFEELLARVRAALRRAHLTKFGRRLEVADLVLDSSSREVTRGGTPIELTAREFDLLEFLMRHEGQVLSRQQIFTAVWGYDYLGESNVIEVYIMALRKKVDAAFEPKLIHTIRHVGYSLRVPR
jgi:two-component system response regulator MprA